MQTQISKDITLLSGDACIGTKTDLAQRDDQGAGSKMELGNSWTTQVLHEDAGRPQQTDRREQQQQQKQQQQQQQQQQQPQQSEFHGRGVRQDACRSVQQGVRIWGRARYQKLDQTTEHSQQELG